MRQEKVREALRRIATNVSIIATRDGDTLHGMTSNAWSEGTNPPLVLITLNRRSRTYGHIKSSGVFSANLLDDSQQDLAIEFAKPKVRNSELFKGLSYHTEATGAPVLDGCIAFFDCSVQGFYPFGDYDIVVGEAKASGPGDSDTPLVYYDGQFMSPNSNHTTQVPAALDEERQRNGGT